MYGERFPEGLVGQGISAELIAAKWGLSRAQVDEYSARSHQRAAETAAAGGFDDEIVPVRVPGKSETVHSHDETVRAQTTVEGLSQLSSPFRDEAMSRASPRSSGTSPPGLPRR